ncbi:unnamed protein product [Mucor fragilis]
MNTSQLDIPQFVVIHDKIHNIYKHPVIHYVFEDEDFPLDIPKDNVILVELDSSASQLKSVDSYSANFQVTDCVLEQSQMSDQFDEDASLLNLTIEGISARKLKEDIEGIQPIKNLDNLREQLHSYKTRNEIIKKVFSSPQTDSSLSKN